jgi:pimeloyl-ACP methyl ester carboxylesterase
MTLESLLGLGPHGFHRVAYADWRTPGSRRTLVCCHGLTRTGRDFDVLAASLEGEYRVVCPDVPGRGRSDWLTPADYGYPVYLSDMAALIARIGADEVDWLGTSMGGLVGMMLAAQPKTPIRRLILNDVGPFLPAAAVARIAAYVGTNPRCGSLAEAEAYLKSVHAPFGPLTGDQWRQLAEHSVRRLPEGGWALHYDPAIAQGFQALPPGDVNLWPVWDAVSCPVLVLRGAVSDVLTADTARAMQDRGPKDVTVRELAGIGHAPVLMDADQIALVREWLGRPL